MNDILNLPVQSTLKSESVSNFSKNENNNISEVPMFKLKQRDDEDDTMFVPSFDTGLSLLSNDKKKINNRTKSRSQDPLGFILNDEESSIPDGDDNHFALFGSNLKRDNSQIFPSGTRSFSVDLTSSSSNPNTFHTINNNITDSSLLNKNIFKPSFTTGINNTNNNNNNNIHSAYKKVDFNKDPQTISSSLLMESTNSTSLEDDINSDNGIFSPKSFLSRPSSISSSSTSEIVNAVVASNKTKKERTRRVKKVKASHNDIERKYRLSINDKIGQLRDIVPTLRYGYKELSHLQIEEKDIDDLDGLIPTKKMNKGTILNKTIEYIKHLETKCEKYKLLNDDLMNRMPDDTHSSNNNTTNNNNDNNNGNNNENGFFSLTTSTSNTSSSSSTSTTSMSSSMSPSNSGTPLIKLENHLPSIPSSHEFNLNILQNSNPVEGYGIPKPDETFSPLAKVFIDNDEVENGNVTNSNLFRFENFA